MNISYIIAGEDALDCALAMGKLFRIFRVRTLMLGGGILNWSFLQEGLCDEISLVIAAAAGGTAKMPALFSDAGGFAENKALSLRLLGIEEKQGGCLWLWYKVMLAGK